MASINNSILWYFADPMCSWCWGFSPVIEQIKNCYEDKLKIALNLGGLRPYTTEVISESLRNEILHHWHEVEKKTSQIFNFTQAMPKGFIYDTEPASRAVLSFATFLPELTLAFFHDLQFAFYAEAKDITHTDVIMLLLKKYDINTNEFLHSFNSNELKNNTLQHFKNTQQAGVSGFPSLVLQTTNKPLFLTRGYKTFEPIKNALDQVLHLD